MIPVPYTHDALDVVASALSIGYDSNDNTTALILPSCFRVDYAANLNLTPLTDLRLGVLSTLFNRTSSPKMVRQQRNGHLHLSPPSNGRHNHPRHRPNLQFYKNQLHLRRPTLRVPRNYRILLQSPTLHGPHPTTNRNSSSPPSSTQSKPPWSSL